MDSDENPDIAKEQNHENDRISNISRLKLNCNGAFVIAPGQGGHHEDGRDTYGHSMIIGPWGEHIASMDHDAPGVLVADIDLAMAAAARARIPNLALERSVEIVKLPS